MAQIDAYLKIKEIPGESQDKTHKDSFDLLDFSIGVSNSGSMSTGGGGGTGQSHFADIPISTYIGKSTPELFLRCSTGKHFDEAVITVRKAGDTPVEFLRITLNQVLVSSYSMHPGHGDTKPQEQWSLNFAKIKYEYQGQDSGGKGLGFIGKWYDLKTHENG